MCENSPVLTVSEFATEWGISRGLAYEAVRTGQVPSIRIGRRILIPRHALEQLLRGNEAAPADTEAASIDPFLPERIEREQR